MPTYKKCVIFILFAAITLFFCNACSLNRKVVISPIGPYLYEENNIRFRINNHQDYWIYFDLPDIPHRLGVYWSMFVESDYMIENIFLESLSFSIEDLGVEISRKNLHHLLLDHRNNKEIPGFWTDVQLDNIYIEEIRDAVSEELTILQLYKKFENVKKISFTVEFKYTVGGQKRTTIVIWNYKTRRETTLAFWDAWMSV
ncbi:MAG: hypothetical protein LBK00_08445 [Treponema sp.]|jgi:hypothetical protein|nr:hypothetical protein [Treponema sp.]